MAKVKIDPNKVYTQVEADELGIVLDLFGKPIIDPARNMSDYFIVPPFSVLDTRDGDWIKRRQKWNNLIGDLTGSRENTLMKKAENSDSKIANTLSDFNKGVSVFDAVLAEIIVKWFTVEGHKVFDPFAGGHFGFVASYFERLFTGMELRKQQADINNKRLKDEGLTGEYINDTSENIDNYIKNNSMDFIFSCPPYMDLEVYSDDPKDLSTMTPDEFFKVYKTILTKTYSKLKQDRFAAIVVSEVRDKKVGNFKGLVIETVNIMREAGYLYYNEIILINSAGTLPLRSGAAMNSGRKVGRMHQNVLIFYKGNPDNIKKNFPEIMPKNYAYNK